MNAIELIGAIGAIVIPLGGLMLKMWNDHSKLARHAMEIQEKISTEFGEVVKNHLKHETDRVQKTNEVLEALNRNISAMPGQIISTLTRIYPPRKHSKKGRSVV